MNPQNIQNIDDVKLYLVSWLQWIDPHDQPNQNGWKQILGFRRGFHIHQVWKRKEEYVFHVSEEDSWNTSIVPNMGKYTGFSDMLNGVSERYAKMWFGESSFKNIFHGLKDKL